MIKVITYSVERYKGNQYGIIASDGNWVMFGKKKDLEKRVKELNAMRIPRGEIDWDRE